jgi:organic hydroperoxide reductase OsmC/OhrA
MKIHARVQNSQNQHQVTLSTNDSVHNLIISPKATGLDSSVNGGELLFLALATCIKVESVEVKVQGRPVWSRSKKRVLQSQSHGAGQ